MWLRLEAVVGDDPERVAIREGLAFGKALRELLRLPLVAERGQPTRVRPRVEPPFCVGRSAGIRPMPGIQMEHSAVLANRQRESRN